MSVVELLDSASGEPFRPPTAGVQLTLAGVHSAIIERWDVLVRGPASVVHVRAAFFPGRVEVVVCDAREHVEEQSVARLVVPLGGPATLEWTDDVARDFPSEPWTMSAGAVTRPDAFGELAEVVARALGVSSTGSSGLSSLAAALSDRLTGLADPAPLALARAQLARHEFRESDLRPVREYVRDHRDDARGHLVFARAMTELGWRSDALSRYRIAFSADLSVRGAPGALEDVASLAETPSLHAQALRLLRQIWAEEAPPLLEAAAARATEPARQSALRALRAELAGSSR